MIPAELIAKKRDHQELSDGEIRSLINSYAAGTLPDYQMSAWAMAVFLNGMTTQETASLTAAMLDSGTRLTWPADGQIRVDKHSTGGIGDKISLILAPLLAACGLQVPMLSGRGLGLTGGTLDKLESIPGFRTDLDIPEITQQTQSVGCVITGASADLAPADRKLYALRDVTATVPCIPLITASIMSKKLAESPDALLFDVKWGSGAFMQTLPEARALAESLVNTSKAAGVKVAALITDMNQPLGRMIGNAVEVQESVDVLRGGGPTDVRELTLLQASELLQLTGKVPDADSARTTAENALDSGCALEKYNQMIIAQGGDPEAGLEKAPATEISVDRGGYLTRLDTSAFGAALIELGGGRRQQGDPINHSVGIECLCRIGDPIEAGQPLFRVFAKDSEPVRQRLTTAAHITPEPTPPAPLVAESIQ